MLMFLIKAKPHPQYLVDASPSEACNGGDERGRDQLVVLHPHLDSREDPVVLLGQIPQHRHV